MKARAIIPTDFRFWIFDFRLSDKERRALIDRFLLMPASPDQKRFAPLDE
jgi:hypothetical protein